LLSPDAPDVEVSFFSEEEDEAGEVEEDDEEDTDEEDADEVGSATLSADFVVASDSLVDSLLEDSLPSLRA
jgi:hypothetical protein